MNFQGMCDARFGAVREEFARNFAERGEVGASVCVVVEGRTVVDLWGGLADRHTGRPWERDTLGLVWSCTKGATALCAHLLRSRGLLDLDRPVASYWPEFARAGKEGVTVRMLLDHQAGLPAVRRPLAPGGLYDWQYMTEALAAEAPFWEPGTRQGYHATTFGHLVGEVVRRVSGRPFDEFFRTEVAGPLGLDFHIEVLKRLLGPAVSLRLDLDPALARSKVDPGQLEQVLLDLAANARDAMPAGGELTLATANVPPAVRLTVRDTGRGMDADTLAHLFEPFFTTKEVGQGSGLGLATVYGTVAQCGGHIEAASAPGAGTTFTLTFPAAPAAPAAPEPGGQIILLVEDEHAVRALARHVLQSQGYTVLEARHAQEALEVHDRHGGPVHLLVSDVMLPHMSGPELARRLSARHPDLRVLFLSGYPREALALEGPPSRFLPKPFRPADLLHTVRELLEARD
jgi:CheY-like chemotaxis protein